MLKNLKTGCIYRNPAPQVKSIHAYFPSVVQMENGDLLSTFVLGETFEAVNLRTYISRSTDNGETWHLEGPVYPGTGDRLTSDFSRITSLPGGELIVLMLCADRTDHPDEGLTNPENLGFVPTEFLIFRSKDYGKTWSKPEIINHPLSDIPLELCSPVTLLRNGIWLIPTSTWNKWDDINRFGDRMIVLVSRDQGKTWPEFIDVMSDPEQKCCYWESKILELPDGRLCAVAWAYNNVEKRDLHDQFSLSGDSGKSWSAPKSTGLMGQTLTPFLLDDKKILSVYRRMDIPGLWAQISRIEGNSWINEDCQPLWGHGASGLTGTSDNMINNFSVLRFGAPCITRLSDEMIFTAFWAYEDCVSSIRWFKFNIE